MLKVWEKDVLQSGRNGLKNEVRPLKRLKNRLKARYAKNISTRQAQCYSIF